MRSHTWIARFIVSGILLLCVATLLLSLLGEWNGTSASELVGLLWFPTVMLFYIIVGILIVSRHPENLVGWLLVAFGLVSYLGMFGRTYAAFGDLPGASVGAWMSVWMELMSIGLLWLAILHFPDGRLLTPRWQWVRLTLITGMGLVGVMAVLLWPHRQDPALLTLFVEETYFGAPTAILRIAQYLLFLSAAATAVSVLLRFRRALGVVRQQIKWLLYAATIGISGSLILLFTGTSPDSSDAPIIGVLLIGLGLFGIPIAIGIAIVRYHLYDIDVIIRKTLVYSVLTGLLALVYFGSVILLQGLFSRLAGVQQSTLAVVISTSSPRPRATRPIWTRCWLSWRASWTRRCSRSMSVSG